jgi:hypothetical protein
VKEKDIISFFPFIALWLRCITFRVSPARTNPKIKKIVFCYTKVRKEISPGAACGPYGLAWISAWRQKNQITHGVVKKNNRK